jgi:CHAT domain-containing protein
MLEMDSGVSTLPGGSVSGRLSSSLFHFAGHGRYEWLNPMESYLLFAGPERLPLGDLLAEALVLSETSLAVLSACETDITDPDDLADEYLGLSSGFLFAGTPAVISTLWAVDDVSTALLMGKFYEKHLTEGQRPGQALRAAQLWLRDEADGTIVSTRIDSVLTGLRRQRSQTPRYSEEAEALNRQIKRLGGRLERLRERKGSSAGNRPFAHPYYWAAFTLAGIASAANAEA